MSMIFPGMDPYLEHPRLWTGLHTRLIVYIGNQLQPQIRPRYVAAVEERVYLQGPKREVAPDVWVRKAKAKEPTGGVALAEPDVPRVVRVPELRASV